RVTMDLEGVRAVLEGVLDRNGLRRQLAELADRHQAGLELDGHRRAEDEPTGFHPNDDVDLLRAVWLEHQIDTLPERGGVLQEGRDVVEEDAGLRKVRDLADPGTELLGRHPPSLPYGRSEPGREEEA